LTGQESALASAEEKSSKLETQLRAAESLLGEFEAAVEDAVFDVAQHGAQVLKQHKLEASSQLSAKAMELVLLKSELESQRALEQQLNSQAKGNCLEMSLLKKEISEIKNQNQEFETKKIAELSELQQKLEETQAILKMKEEALEAETTRAATLSSELKSSNPGGTALALHSKQMQLEKREEWCSRSEKKLTMVSLNP
jgi:hypothetical protein